MVSYEISTRGSLSTDGRVRGITMAGYGTVRIEPNTPLNAAFDTAIISIIFVLPLIGHLASLTAMKFYDLDEKKMEEVTSGIEQKKAALQAG